MTDNDAAVTEIQRLGEEVSGPYFDLEAAVAQAWLRFNTLTPEQQREHREAQRKSWVKGETLLENPDMTEDEFERLWAANHSAHSEGEG